MSAAADEMQVPNPDSAKSTERRALGVACGAHALHDGYTDLVYILLPIWQNEFGLGFAALGLMRTVFSG
ncbi:MAG: MFS transporter, partial [Pseudolabrys sp.]